VVEFVNRLATIPSVSLPVRWSCLSTIWTLAPGLILLRCVPVVMVLAVCAAPVLESAVVRLWLADAAISDAVIVRLAGM